MHGSFLESRVSVEVRWNTTREGMGAAFAQEVREAGADTTCRRDLSWPGESKWLGILVLRAQRLGCVSRVCEEERTEVSPLGKACWQRPVR